MFAKDVQLLNEIYKRKIVTEDLGLGPQADLNTDGLTPIKRAKIELGLPVKKCINCETEEDCESCDGTCGEMDMDHEEIEHSEHESEESENADMAKQSLFRLVKLSAMLHDLIQHNAHIEPWVLTKISDAHRNIEAVYGYQDYESFKHKVDDDIENIEEETEQDLYRSIATGGDIILSKLKKMLATESKVMLENILFETITALEKKKR
jgi:hypothetical protein